MAETLFCLVCFGRGILSVAACCVLLLCRSLLQMTTANEVLLPIMIIFGVLLVILPGAWFFHRKRQERLMREACAEHLSQYLPMTDDAGSLEVPLFRHQMPQLGER